MHSTNRGEQRNKRIWRCGIQELNVKTEFRQAGRFSKYSVYIYTQSNSICGWCGSFSSKSHLGLIRPLVELLNS
jgi:hypothetical protein